MAGKPQRVISFSFFFFTSKFCCFSIFSFIEVELIYNSVLISAVQRRDSGSQRTGLWWSTGRERGAEGVGVGRCERSPLEWTGNTIQHRESFRDCGSGGGKDSGGEQGLDRPGAGQGAGGG